MYCFCVVRMLRLDAMRVTGARCVYGMRVPLDDTTNKQLQRDDDDDDDDDDEWISKEIVSGSDRVNEAQRAVCNGE